MGGKKKGGKKGGKKGKAGAIDYLDEIEQNHVLEAIKESLTAKLIAETDSADKCKAAENEKRFRELQLERKVKDEQKLQMDIISDMTRQYKSVEEELFEQISRLEQRKSNNEEEIKILKKKEADLEADIKEIKAKKQTQIDGLKKNIENMS